MATAASGGRLDARQQLHAYVAARRARDPREELVAAAVEHRDRVADAQPQHAREMLRLVARQGDRVVAWIERWARKSGARRDYMEATSSRVLGAECLGAGVLGCRVLGARMGLWVPGSRTSLEAIS